MKRFALTLITAGTIATLAGCATLNEGLKSVSDSMGKSAEGADQPRPSSSDTPYESTFTYTSGGTRRASFVIPARVCARDEFINNYEVSYAGTWNDQVRMAGLKYSVAKTKEQKEAAASLSSKTLITVKRLPAPSYEEVQRRGRTDADCVQLETLGSGKGEAQARADFEAEGIR